MQASYTEIEVIALLKVKDEKIFSYLYEKYSKCLYNVILRIIPDKVLAADLLQEAFIHIWSHAENYDKDKSRLFTWMLCITRHVTIDMLRSKGYRNSLKVQENWVKDGDVFFDIAAETNPEIINHAGLEQALPLLKPQLRVLIELVYFQGYKQAEVAALLGIPLGTVKTRLGSAMTQLKVFLIKSEQSTQHFGGQVLAHAEKKRRQNRQN